MLSYLHSAGLRDTYEALKRETDNEDYTTDDPKAKWVGLLEKKWTSVIRLQKKVCKKITARLDEKRGSTVSRLMTR
jgi:platelet-activating factor acetylhydrolase IB subunit alpha